MVDTITLSFPAVDVLGEQLNLNVRQYPFEFPRGSAEERERVSERVRAELASAGLASEGRPEPEVEDALYLLCSSEISIAVAGLLDVRTGERLAARVVATGEVGVAGVVTNSGLRMDFMAPDDLPEVCAGLLPDAPRGGGETVTVLAEHARGDAPEEAHENLRTIEAVAALTRYRIGHYAVTGTDRRGRRARLPGLAWFDTDYGRYTMLGDRDSHGQDTLTCTPADRDGVAAQVGALLDRARAE